jgi:hypothetical protein
VTVCTALRRFGTVAQALENYLAKMQDKLNLNQLLFCR